MNLTAATITVYFIGLMTFQEHTGGGREVIVPQAGEALHHKGELLARHRAFVVIHP